MKHPNCITISLVNDGVESTAAAVAVIRGHESLARGRREAYRIGTRLLEARRQCQGNRNDEVPLTFKDLRLVLAAGLRILLEELEDARDPDDTE